MRERPGWLAVALAAACAFLLGVVFVVVIDGGGNGGADDTATVTAPTRTVTVPATRTTGGTVIVTTAVPDVTGQRLDVAKDRLHRSRFDVDVDGGGLFGVIKESNWEVVSQDPAPGTQLEQGSSVRVKIERR